MATMLKEKKPKKKKSKSKYSDVSDVDVAEVNNPSVLEESKSPLVDSTVDRTNLLNFEVENYSSENIETDSCVDIDPTTLQSANTEQTLSVSLDAIMGGNDVLVTEDQNNFEKTNIFVNKEEIGISYIGLQSELKSLTIQFNPSPPNDVIQEANVELYKECQTELEEVAQASAPLFNEISLETIDTASIQVQSMCNTKTKVPCLPIDEAIRIFGGKEMCEVKELSDQEEALVEVGGHLQPQHPLVDLITHLRSSLAAVERERQRISHGYKEEQKARSVLWKVEKRKKNISEKCTCGADVVFSITFDYAELQKDKLASAKFRLKALLRDVLDSYCSHQHEAMLTYCEIEDLIGLITNRSKQEIRDSLAFILHSLKCSDEFGDVYVKVLQEWAFSLASALFDKELQMRDLLFLMHILFRQSRSVRWAERVLRIRVDDFSTAAQFIAFLDILLSQPVPDAAIECIEETQDTGAEAWEELDAFGSSGAVGKGRLRESDMLAILKALPLRELIASLVLLSKEEMDGQHSESWSGATGGGVLKASCGVRVLLHVVARALPLYRAYTAVHELLRRVALSALKALAALHMQSRSWYQSDIEGKIWAELEACFVLGFTYLDQDRHNLPTTLLDDDTVVEYCLAFMSGLHANAPRRIELLSVEAPAMACDECVRVVAHAAAEQRNNALANIVLEFLLQTGIKRSVESCRGGCDSVARELIPLLLTTHPYLHTTSFYILGDKCEVEAIDASSVAALSPAEWRPSPVDVKGVLDDWTRKCPALIEYLLLQIDCTPHKGLSLESQLAVGSWLCQFTRGRGEADEWAWSVMRRLRPHRAHWGLPLDAPPPDFTDTLLELAYALLSSEWGHLVPLVCSAGVKALQRLATARPADAVHCLDSVMRVLALSPESISLTPEFSDVFTAILNAGPNLVQRALGRGGLSGRDMLRRLILDQLHEHESCPVRRSALMSAWLHALWRPAPAPPPAPARTLLDAALRATRDWPTLDAYVTYILEVGGSQVVAEAVSHTRVAPLLALGALRGALTQENRAGLAARLLPALAHQRSRGERVHVDNALKFIGSKLTSDELVIHRTAASALLAPLEDPSHLTLWSLFFHLYLQRPPDATSEGTPPAGPLFFSGIIKTRTLNQLKRRLQEAAIYHHDAATGLKSRLGDVTTAQATGEDNTTNEADDCIFPPLTLADLRGDADLISEPSISIDNDGDVKTDENKKEVDDTPNLISYHTAAEKLVAMYERWLQEGEAVRAQPHLADAARHVTEQDLNAAWRASLGSTTDTPTATPPPPTQHTHEYAPAIALTHYEQMIQAIDTFKYTTSRRNSLRRSQSSLTNINYNDQRAVIAHVEKHLAVIEKLVASWSSEVSRVRTLDDQLWPAVARLRTRCQLPRVRQPCPKGCRPLLIHLQEHEWRLSSAAIRDIEENRRNAAAAVRRVAQPKTRAARVTAALIAISRRITDKTIALRVLETLYCSVNEEKAPAHRSLISFINFLAELILAYETHEVNQLPHRARLDVSRWVCADGVASARLLERWSGAGAHTLCGAVVHPARPHVRSWRPLYRALLQARLPPPALFSYLSRFDMAYWATAVSAEERREVLAALLEAAQRFGEKSDEEYQMLIELVGVHSGKICLACDTLHHVQRCVRVAGGANRAPPPAYFAHLAPLVLTHRTRLDFTQLEQLFPELGSVWSGSNSYERHVAYAPHVAALLRALQRAYVVAATEQSYTPENVGARAWVVVREAWTPWVGPAHSLLPPDAHVAMLDHFVDALLQLADDCPGSDVYLLRHAWEWAVEAWLEARERSQGAELLAGAMLAQLRRLPWDRQWFTSANLPTAHKVSWLDAPELNAWCSYTWSRQKAGTWTRGVPESQLPQVLPVLFEIFTSKYLQLSVETLEGACLEGWRVLPADVVERLQDAYYGVHHDPARPYHDLPHFKLVLTMSELTDSCALDEKAQLKRCQGVTQWAVRASAPALAPQARDHARRLLLMLDEIAPCIGNYGNYLEELLSRAIVSLCMEPGAHDALPVWQQWVRSCTPRVRRACAVAVGALCAADTFAPLVDTLAQQLLADTCEGSGWCVLWRQLRGCLWSDAALQRHHYHAAYALLRAAPLTAEQMCAALSVLTVATVPFVEKEVIIALWICALCRLALEYDVTRGVDASSSEGGSEKIAKGWKEEVPDRCREVERGVRALLLKWVELKRSLLQVVTLQHATVPTQRHRLLCYLALCILSSPSNLQSPSKEYEIACQSAASLGINPTDIIKWGQAPKPAYLPRLAMMLFPDQKIYFEEELNLVTDF